MNPRPWFVAASLIVAGVVCVTFAAAEDLVPVGAPGGVRVERVAP